MTAASFLFFTLFVAVIAWWRSKGDDQKSTTGYFLAGRSLPWIVVGGSLLLTNLSTEQLVGLNGGAYQNGMIVMAWEVWSAIAIVIMAVVFLPRYLKSGITTIPEYLELRYSPMTRTLTSIIFLASIVFNVLPFVLYSGAIFMIEVFGVADITGWNTGNGMATANLALMCSALAVVGGCYAIFGGLRAVAVSDTVNGAGLVVGGLLIPFLGLMYIGDDSLTAGVSVLIEDQPHRLSSLGDRASNIPWETLFTGMTLITTYYWCTNQGIVQRTFAAQNLASGQKGVLFAALMKLAGPLYLVLPGIIAWHIASGGAASVPDNGNGAYAFLVNLVLPDWARGFFAAAIFGAILSSFNSFLNSGSTLFSLDLYKGVIQPDATDLQLVRVGKIFGSVVCVLSILLALAFAPFAAKGLFDLMKNIAAMLNIPLLAIVFMGFVTKRTPAIAANVALVVGMAFQGIFGLWLGNNLLGLQMHWLHLAAVNFLVLVSIMLLMQVIAPRSEAFVQQYSKDVDITPWKAAVPVGLIILVLIAVMYAGMAWKFGITPGDRLTDEYHELHPPAESTTDSETGGSPGDVAALGSQSDNEIVRESR